MPAILALGFRPFFLGAAIFSMVSIGLWTAVYAREIPLAFAGITAFQWHAHEMIYGYGLAVIAGFLLTAARNWTGIQTLKGSALLGLVCLWAAARACFLFGSEALDAAAVFDLLFIAALIVAVAAPIIRVRQWRHLAILGKLVLFGAANLCFYLGAGGMLERGVHWGIYGGLYLVVALILTMGRRVIPSFIERGVGYPVQLRNRRWIDISSMLFLLGFFVAEVFLLNYRISALCAAGMFVVLGIRLIGWFTPGVWKKPLLWSLLASLAFIDLGFLMFACSPFLPALRLPAVHALGYGGIGIVTLGMMARVALGHTGRDIHNAPRTVPLALIFLVIGALIRVLLPPFAPGHYATWILFAQGFWTLAFALFLISYLPILMRPRVDGQPG